MIGQAIEREGQARAARGDPTRCANLNERQQMQREAVFQASFGYSVAQIFSRLPLDKHRAISWKAFIVVLVDNRDGDVTCTHLRSGYNALSGMQPRKTTERIAAKPA